jgi:hypothetical protein
VAIASAEAVVTVVTEPEARAEGTVARPAPGAITIGNGPAEIAIDTAAPWRAGVAVLTASTPQPAHPAQEVRNE